ncbi:dolichyl-phosphate-mannose-protein mannosyltransferase [Nocardia tenerifensis]|uniref:Dolichyl-phosphate-mannose-protein mannosyltransferase n=1 Tax=Nocardia tenerifensis TaxID=228006 RepID=A0A318JUB9_9NOCA|nr:glycosyltransferase family 39 protein [Nocardia tenerifensis]PXX59252.1 dolichyl-phosphate-mannose-protein mannosyltransferase [Nocardia tenerifensis]
MTDATKTQGRQAFTAEKQPPFALAGVGSIAVVSAIALLASAGRYGFFGDELYFISAGRRLAFSYADQGPLLPAIARLMDLLAPESLVAQRIPAMLVTVAAVVISAQIAREFGGGRNAQLLTAAAYATSPFLLVQGTQLATNTIDTALWVLISWLLVRWVRTRRDALLLWASLVTALDMQVKWLIPFFWFAIAVGVLLYGPRELLRRPALWAGVALVVVVTLPSLIWQVAHDWPQLRLGGVVAAEQASVGGRYIWLPLAIASAGLLGGLLLIYGIVALFRWEPLRPYRFVAPLPLLLTVAFIATNGRPYYAAGCYAVIMAAGAVRWTAKTSRTRTIVNATIIVASVALVAFSMPWRPESAIEPAKSETDAGLSIGLYGRFGWPELAEATAAAYRALPEADRAHTVIIAESYWQAAALDVLGPADLPAVYSPSRGFGYFGTPPDAATTVLWVGNSEAELRPLFTSVTLLTHAGAPLGYPGASRDVPLWLGTHPITPWSQSWPTLQHL